MKHGIVSLLKCLKQPTAGGDSIYNPLQSKKK